MMIRLLKRHLFGRRVDRSDFLLLIRPVPEPISVDPNVRLAVPSRRLVFRKEKLAFLNPFGSANIRFMRPFANELRNLNESLVRIARNTRRFPLEEEFRTGGRRSQIVESVGFQIDRDNLVANVLFEPREIPVVQRHRHMSVPSPRETEIHRNAVPLPVCDHVTDIERQRVVPQDQRIQLQRRHVLDEPAVIADRVPPQPYPAPRDPRRGTDVIRLQRIAEQII